MQRTQRKTLPLRPLRISFAFFAFKSSIPANGILTDKAAGQAGFKIHGVTFDEAGLVCAVDDSSGIDVIAGRPVDVGV
jgi:hypothetical protein